MGEVLHITFGDSVAGTLREALAGAGRGGEAVPSFPDLLSPGRRDVEVSAIW
jgi:hypothetical protein